MIKEDNEYIPDYNLNKLIPYANNPRLNDEIDELCNSINDFGFNSPIILADNLEVIAGHTRIKALRSLGRTTAPVIICHHIKDRKMAAAYRLADNKTGEISGWDFNKLNIELDGLKDIFDMEDYGFVNYESFDDPFSTPEGDEPQSAEGEGTSSHSDDFTLMVSCFNEADMDALYDQLTGEGRVCRKL